MNTGAASLAALSELSPRAFVQAAYDAILGRPPTPLEREMMLAALLQGDARTWLIGNLRYSGEGRGRGVLVPGLRMRYTAQRLFRVPGIGPVIEWLCALARLPSSLRYLRAIRQLDAERHEQAHQADREQLVAVALRYDDLRRQRCDDLGILAALERRHDETLQNRQGDLERMAVLDRGYTELSERAREMDARLEAEVERRRADGDRIDLLHGLC
ncbi:MAG TPA: hypothetical protein VFZ14_14780, partial [Burkholderiales bacterium]|nr:hypothetical protein [Burkholderiales bacterium]